MQSGTRYYSKKQWKDNVWRSAWEIEDQDCGFRTALLSSSMNLKRMSEKVYMLIWWQLGDLRPELMYQCDVMVKLICRASNLKCDNYKFKNAVGMRYCDICQSLANENAEHIILHCPFFTRYK